MVNGKRTKGRTRQMRAAIRSTQQKFRRDREEHRDRTADMSTDLTIYTGKSERIPRDDCNQNDYVNMTILIDEELEKIYGSESLRSQMGENKTKLATIPYNRKGWYEDTYLFIRKEGKIERALKVYYLKDECRDDFIELLENHIKPYEEKPGARKTEDVERPSRRIGNFEY